MRALQGLLKALIVVFILMLIFIAGILFFTEGPLRKYQLYGESLVQKTKKEDFVQHNTSYIYDSKDKLIAKISNGEGYGNYIPYRKIPKDVVNAFVAIEDRTFWDNEGYDPGGISRVIYRYIKTRGKESHGASTITQQLARLHYLTTEKTLDRKFKEIAIAKALDHKFSKKEIMEFYVNNCYFANGNYGIEAASKSYFGKSVSDLSLSQMAYLCAIPNSPTYYDPRKNPENALKRRDKILKDMLECDYISNQKCKEALKEEIVIKDPPKYKVHDYQTTYAIDCAVRTLMTDFKFKYHFSSMKEYKKYREKYDEAYDEAKKKLYNGGYKVYTSLDSSKQKKMQEIVNKEFKNKSKNKEGIFKLQAAMTIIDNETGKVVVVIGGRKQDKFKDEYTYNRAFQCYRQPGSSFKPIAVYTPALMKDYTADTIVENIDVSVAKKMNKHEDVAALGGEKMPLRIAVEKSRNGVAYSVFNDIGVSYGLKFINKMEFSRVVPDDYTLSSALGGLTYGVNTVEMASAYSTLINGGVFRSPTCITSILDYKGNQVYKEKESKKVYSVDASQEMIDILKGVIKNGTAKDMNWDSPVPAAGKTGTTNNQKDGWFCGVTPFYTACVWVGYDKPKTLDDLYGATYPAEIWKKAMSKLVAGKEKQFEKEEEVEEYFPGRDDSEELSDGYTIGDYRDDRRIGKKIDETLKKFDKAESIYDLQKLYEEALDDLESIISVKYTKEKGDEIENLYNQIYEELE